MIPHNVYICLAERADGGLCLVLFFYDELWKLFFITCLNKGSEWPIPLFSERGGAQRRRNQMNRIRKHREAGKEEIGAGCFVITTMWTSTVRRIRKRLIRPCAIIMYVPVTCELTERPTSELKREGEVR